MDNSLAAQYGGYVMSAFLAAYSLWQTRRAEQRKAEVESVQKQLTLVSKDDLSTKNQELAEAYKLKAEEWQATWKKEHEEGLAYRKIIHDQREQQNAEHLKLVEENATLRSRTDLTPIIEHIKEQSEANREVANTLAKLTEVITDLMEEMKEARKNHANNQ